MKIIINIFFLLFLSSINAFAINIAPVRFRCELQAQVKASEEFNLRQPLPEQYLYSILRIDVTNGVYFNHSRERMTPNESLYRGLAVINSFQTNPLSGKNQLSLIDPQFHSEDTALISFNYLWPSVVIQKYLPSNEPIDPNKYVDHLPLSMELNQNTHCNNNCFDKATNTLEVLQTQTPGIIRIKQHYKRLDGQVDIVFTGECRRFVSGLL